MQSTIGRFRRTMLLGAIVVGATLFSTAAFAAGQAKPKIGKDAPHMTDRAYIVAQSGGIETYNLYSDGSIERNGEITPTPPGTFGINASPDNKYIYVAPGAGLGTKYSVGAWGSTPAELLTYEITANGGLRKVASTPVAAGTTLVTGWFSRDGRDLYYGAGTGPAGFDAGSASVLHYRIGANGVPAQIGDPVKLGGPNDGVPEPILSKDGKWLYVIAFDTSKAAGGFMTNAPSVVVRFAVNPDGSLSAPIDRTVVGGRPITPIIAPDGKTLYIDMEFDNNITALTINADGSLTPVPGSPFRAGAIPHNFSFAHGGRFLYAGNTGGTPTSDSFPTNLGNLGKEGSINGYQVGPNGALAPLPGSAFKSEPGAMTVNVSSDNKHLFLTSSPQGSLTGQKPWEDFVRFTSYPINEDGTLGEPRQSVVTGLHTADGPETVLISVAPGASAPK